MADVKFTLGGRDLVIKSMKLGVAKVALPKLSKWQGNLFDSVQIDNVIGFLEDVLKQTNDGLTREWLEAELDLSQLDLLIGKIGEASGLKAAEPGKAESP